MFFAWYNTMQMDLPSTQPTEIAPQAVKKPTAEEIRQRRILIATLIGGAVVIVALLVASLIFMLGPGEERAQTVERIRDIFIIFMALETLIIGLALTILIVQLARLTNLLQNEIRPILDSTNTTVNTLRGTTEFLSDNLVQPVMKINEYLAALKKLAELLGLGR